MRPLSSRITLSLDDLILLRDEPALIAVADAIRSTQRVRWFEGISESGRVSPSRSWRSSKLTIALVALTLVVVGLTGAAIAGVLDLFEGTPATSVVKERFEVWNTESGWEVRSGQIGPPLTSTGTPPAVDPSNAHGVLEVEVGEGAVYQLWAAPLDGGGECAIIQRINAEGNVLGGSVGASDSWCITESTPETPRAWGEFGSPSSPSIRVLAGKAPNATSVEIEFTDGTTTRSPVVEGFFLVPVKGAPRSSATKPIKIVSYDANGNEVGMTGS